MSQHQAGPLCTVCCLRLVWCIRQTDKGTQTLVSIRDQNIYNFNVYMMIRTYALMYINIYINVYNEVADRVHSISMLSRKSRAKERSGEEDD
jgi:hypothetical protein